MFRQLKFATMALLVFSAPGISIADTLIVDGLNQTAGTVSERPNRGQSMDKVESVWGQPQAKQGAVGDPPISRWEYSDFIVYFEYQHVIHAVRKQ
jgi:hypothetical protein